MTGWLRHGAVAVAAVLLLGGCASSSAQSSPPAVTSMVQSDFDKKFDSRFAQFRYSAWMSDRAVNADYKEQTPAGLRWVRYVHNPDGSVSGEIVNGMQFRCSAKPVTCWTSTDDGVTWMSTPQADIPTVPSPFQLLMSLPAAQAGEPVYESEKDVFKVSVGDGSVQYRFDGPTLTFGTEGLGDGPGGSVTMTEPVAVNMPVLS